MKHNNSLQEDPPLKNDGSSRSYKELKFVGSIYRKPRKNQKPRRFISHTVIIQILFNNCCLHCRTLWNALKCLCHIIDVIVHHVEQSQNRKMLQCHRTTDTYHYISYTYIQDSRHIRVPRTNRQPY